VGKGTIDPAIGGPDPTLVTGEECGTTGGLEEARHPRRGHGTQCGCRGTRALTVDRQEAEGGDMSYAQGEGADSGGDRGGGGEARRGTGTHSLTLLTQSGALVDFVMSVDQPRSKKCVIFDFFHNFNFLMRRMIKVGVKVKGNKYLRMDGVIVS
jgi:hypothetical protein